MDGAELLEQPARADAVAPPEHRHDGAHRLDLLRERRPEPPHEAGVGRADVAQPAAPAAVGAVAEVPDQPEHAAAAVVGEAGHLVDLVEPVPPLRPVGAAPRVGAAAHPVAAADDGAAVDAKLVQGGLERVLVQAQPTLQIGPFRRRLPQRVVEFLEVADLGIGELVQELLGPAVGPGVQQQRPRRLAVPAGAADLLVVALDRRRHRRVDDGADVRLVDPHAEGRRGHHDLDVAAEERGLHVVPLRRRQPGVVGGGGELVGQPTGERLRLLARRRVDDGGPPLRSAQHLGDDRRPRPGPLLHHLDGQVLAPEAVDVALVPLEVELGGDVVLDARRRGGGQGQHRRRTQPRQALAQQPVVGTEVVAPLGDAVRLVDRDQLRPATFQELDEAGDAQPLGRDEQEVQLAVAVEPAGLPRLVPRPPGVDAFGAQPELAQLGRLILHQRDERREDEGRTAAEQARKLVAERLAGAGRHDDEAVVAVRRAAADLFLVGAEGGVAEDLPQPFVQCRSRRHAVVRPSRFANSPAGRAASVVAFRGAALHGTTR